MTKPVIAVSMLAGVVALGGCQTYQERPNTAAGATIGAISGAAIGSAVGARGRRTEGALIGAAGGALAGGLIGNYMDEQERQLRAQMAGTGIDVQRVGDNIVLNLPEGVTFDVGRAEIKPQFYYALDRVAETLRYYDRSRIEIQGHTDSTGSYDFNQRLSENRAFSVRSYLASRGVAPDRMYAVGFGPSRPIADNSSPYGRAKNRRVEIIVIPTS